MKKLRIHAYELKSGIRRTPEFEKKRLAKFAVNVGLKCGHSCSYCSSGALLRCHKAFKKVGESPFEFGYAIVDPDMPRKVALDAKRKRGKGLVQLCTTVDPYCPAAQKYDLGRRCLEAILSQPGWTVRILTKNAAVVKDFDLIKKHKDRVLVGLSLTATPDKDDVMAAVEPNASTISERLLALAQAHRLGLRTYGMLCPLLPGVADQPRQISELVTLVKACGAEEVFAEAVNPRGPGLKNTEEVLRQGGFSAEAKAVGLVRKQTNWSPYVADLVGNVQRAMRQEKILSKLRFLLYPSGLAAKDEARIRKDDAGVIWL